MHVASTPKEPVSKPPIKSRKLFRLGASTAQSSRCTVRRRLLDVRPPGMLELRGLSGAPFSAGLSSRALADAFPHAGPLAPPATAATWPSCISSLCSPLRGAAVLVCSATTSTAEQKRQVYPSSGKTRTKLRRLRLVEQIAVEHHDAVSLMRYGHALAVLQICMDSRDLLK